MPVGTVLAFLLLGQSAAAGPPEGKIVVLEPSVSKGLFPDPSDREQAYQITDRVLPRLERESRKWEGWGKVRIVSQRDTVRLQRALLGPRGSRTLTFERLGDFANRLKARYVVYYSLGELTGARTRGFGARVTGRAKVDLRVYDSVLNALVFSGETTQTSTKKGSQYAMEPRVEQAYLNALREGMEPFVVQGFYRAVPAGRTLLDSEW